MSSQNKQIIYIPLDRIEPHADNPNVHSEENVQTLALNIREFGLLHPIGVVSKALDRGYTIVIGEGRFNAFQLLNQQWPGEGGDSIPAIVLEESDDYSVWGRRLSENRLRSFNWVGECIELTNMKEDGKSRTELAKLFGYSEDHIGHITAIGEIPGIEKVAGAAPATQVALRDIEKYVLPLSIQTARQGNVPVWDYSEVTTCIEKLATGELRREDLPAHSAERREAIGKAKAEKVEKPDSPETAKLQKDLKALEEAAETRKAHNSKQFQELEHKTQQLEKTQKAMDAREAWFFQPFLDVH